MKIQHSLALAVCVIISASGCSLFSSPPPCSRSAYFSDDHLDVICARLQTVESRAQMLMVAPDITNAYMLVCADRSLALQTENWTATLFESESAMRQELVTQLSQRCSAQPALADLIAFVGRIPMKEQPKDLDCSAVSAAYAEVLQACRGVIEVKQ